MSSSSRSPDDGDGPRTADSASRPVASPAAKPSDPGRVPPALRLTIVENDDDPDRGTVYPPGLTGIDRMETWLSVDASVVVELAAWR